MCLIVLACTINNYSSFLVSYCRHASVYSFCFPYLMLRMLPLWKGCRNPIDIHILKNLQHKLKDSTWISKNWLVLRSGDKTLNCPSVIRESGWVLSLRHRRHQEIRNSRIWVTSHIGVTSAFMFHLWRLVFAHQSFVFPAHKAVYECPVSSHVISPPFILFSRGPECILTDQTRVWCLFAS